MAEIRQRTVNRPFSIFLVPSCLFGWGLLAWLGRHLTENQGNPFELVNSFVALVAFAAVIYTLRQQGSELAYQKLQLELQLGETAATNIVLEETSNSQKAAATALANQSILLQRQIVVDALTTAIGILNSNIEAGIGPHGLTGDNRRATSVQRQRLERALVDQIMSIDDENAKILNTVLKVSGRQR